MLEIKINNNNKDVDFFEWANAEDITIECKRVNCSQGMREASIKAIWHPLHRTKDENARIWAFGENPETAIVNLIHEIQGNGYARKEGEMKRICEVPFFNMTGLKRKIKKFIKQGVKS